jgi:hypothetical protein
MLYDRHTQQIKDNYYEHLSEVTRNDP